MADWNKPTITSDYINFVAEMNAKFVDAATLQFGNPINFPLNTIRWNRSLNLFQEWLGVASGWQNKNISIEGGGTAANSAAGARTNLGIGSMGTQNSNAVTITGGSITGVTYSASDITTGVMALARGGTGASLTLAPYGSVLLSSGASVVFDNGSAISALNASNLSLGTVPIARLSADIAYLPNNQTWGGVNVFPRIDITGAEADIFWYSTLGDVNKKRMRMAFYVGNMYFIRQADGGADIATPFYITADDVLNGNGAGFTNLNANNIVSGTVAPARLGSGSPSAATYLRGDGVWSTIATGGEVSPIPSGLIAMFDTACPAGWTRFSQLDNRFPLGSGSAGAVGGGNTHSHAFSAGTDGAGSHAHGFSGSGSGTIHIDKQTDTIDGGANVSAQIGTSYVFFNPGGHSHRFRDDPPFNVTISGSTDGVGNHTHNVNGGTDVRDHTPPYFTVVYCRKN